MEIVYKLTEDKCLIDNRTRVSYGIEVYDVSSGTEILIVKIEDIDDNKEKLEALVNHCNELTLSPLHIINVVEDYLVNS